LAPHVWRGLRGRRADGADDHGGHMDEDLDALTREQLLAEVKRLRAGVRAHRDATGQDLCWHQPALWSLLPEAVMPAVAVPDWPRFMRGCVRYRQSLDDQLPAAPRTAQEPSR
jgi:hypothetical protein